ncbi:MAG: pyridoxamine 5'-phosphate oxidase family protein [Chloroflexota bacterium]
MANYQRQPMNTGVSEERLLHWNWVVGQIELSHHYWLSSTRPDGRPHVVPIAAIWHDEALYFSLSLTSVKGRNISQQPRVAIHLESSRNVVILEGVAQPADNASIRDTVLPRYIERYNFTPPVTENNQWLNVHPDRVLAWILSDSYNTATRWTTTAQ